MDDMCSSDWLPLIYFISIACHAVVFELVFPTDNKFNLVHYLMVIIIVHLELKLFENTMSYVS